MTDLMQYLRDNIELVLGGDWHETANFFEDDEVTAKNTTGYSMTMTIFSSSNGEVYDVLTVANGKVIHTPASGQFNFNLTVDEILAYEFRSASYRMVVDYGDGNVQAIRVGTIKVVDS
jgi:hypothetical protein